MSLSAYGYFADDVPAGGGAERQLYLLSKELNETFDISFIAGDFGQDTICTTGNITHYRAYSRDVSAAKHERVRHVYKLYKAMDRAEADIYVYRGQPRKSVVVHTISKILGSSYVYNLANDSNVGRDLDKIPFPLNKIFISMLRRSDGVITQSEYQRKQLENKFKIPGTVIPNGYPQSDENIPYIKREGILWVGRFDQEQKRPHLFLDLAEELPKITFRLIGRITNDEEYGKDIKRRAERIPNVEFVGEVHPNNIHDYYKYSSALVNTSCYEGFPNTFLEAWRQGTPVVSLCVDPGKFITVDHTNYCEGSWDSLKRNVKLLENNIETKRTNGESARDYFENNLTISKVASKYVDTLESISTPA